MNDPPSLGVSLRKVRQSRSLTLKQVSGLTGMALSTLSKVENGQMSLTYDKLLQLTAGLGIEIAELFSSPTLQAAKPTVVTARRSVSRPGTGETVETPFYTYRYQCVDIVGKRMIPIVAEVRARTLAEFGPLLRHAGEEYFHVTEGRVAVHTEFYAPEILDAGEGIYLDSSMGHAYLNAGDGPAKAVCLCTSEDDGLYEQLVELATKSGSQARR